MAAKPTLPSLGDTVCVPPSNHATGGTATVEGVSGNFVTVAEIPDWCFHWDFIRPLQSKLRKRYSAVSARPLAPGEEPEHFAARPDPPEGLF